MNELQKGSEVIPTHSTLLGVDELRETSEYVEKLTNSPDITSGAESDEHTGELVRKTNS